jgi:hypothetical protein
MEKDTCRGCKHNSTGHFKRLGNDKFICCHCPCFDYIPYDNLEYLEWLYNKKVDNIKPDVKI